MVSLARQVPGGDRRRNDLGVLGSRQIPGVDRRTHVVYERSSPFYQTRPSNHSVHIMHTPPAARVSKLSALIVGIARAIFGVCIFPANPIAGFIIGGVGGVIAASGAIAYNAGRR